MAVNSSGYSNREIHELKEDAMRRVREMQSRVRQTVQSSNASLSGIPAAQTAPPPRTQSHPTPIPPSTHNRPDEVKPKTNHPAPLLKLPFELDNDRIVLLALVYLLISEGADNMLILALLYLLI